MSAPACCLILSTYEQPEYLARVLAAVSRQSVPPRETILADDGSGETTAAVWRTWAAAQSWRCERVWQEHEGFRKARILNEAVARSRADYLVFLDGDTLPHPRFLADHRTVARPGVWVQGHRVLVGRRAAVYFGLGPFAQDRWRALWQGQMQGVKQAFRWWRPWRRRRRDLRGVRGCNFGVWRADLERVNGFNEAFVGWGREDAELVQRLYHAGVGRLDVRGWLLSYHLWHPPASRDRLPANEALLASAHEPGRLRCERGLSLHTSSAPAEEPGC